LRPNWPGLFVIGAPKCGTTSVFDLLCQIDGLAPSSVKEPNYFEYDANYRRGHASYVSLFSGSNGSQVGLGFEATPWYLYSKHAALRIHSDIGRSCRFIVCTRDPVERAISHYRDFRGGGREARGFRTAFEQEIKDLSDHGPVFQGRHTSYISASFVSSATSIWVEMFGREAFFFVDLQDLITDPLGLSNELATWLGKNPPDPGSIERIRHKNEASGLRSISLYRVPAAILRTRAGGLVRRALPWTAYARFGELWRAGARSSSRAIEIEANDREWLREWGEKRFADERRRLQEIAHS
jgi:hypothetical protein